MKLIARSVLTAALLSTAVAQPALALCASNSGVFGSVSQYTPTSWIYTFTVMNGCHTSAQPFMTDFYLPYFADAGIANITVPAPDTHFYAGAVTWTATIQPGNNLFNLSKAGVIDFHVTATPEFQVGTNQTTPGVPYYSASGFSFTAAYDGVKGPDAIRQTPYDGGAYSGTNLLFEDPPIPGSPMTLDALGNAPITTTPEPATSALIAVGLATMAAVLRRRRCAT